MEIVTIGLCGHTVHLLEYFVQMNEVLNLELRCMISLLFI